MTRKQQSHALPASSYTPLKSLSDDIEDYQTLSDEFLHSSSMRKSRVASMASSAYQSATKAFALILCIALVTTISLRFSMAKTGTAYGGALDHASAPVPQVGSSLTPPLCEDEDAAMCIQLLASDAETATANTAGFPSLPPSCSAHGNGVAAARCPKSCGLCAVVLADCHRVEIIRDGCSEEDAVGQVCSDDDDMKKEAYCTWIPSNHTVSSGYLRSSARVDEAPRRFVCAHCADERMSLERRALMGQMLEMRSEEDDRARDASDLSVHDTDGHLVTDSLEAEKDALRVLR